MAGRDGLRLLLLWMVGRFWRCAPALTGGADRRAAAIVADPKGNPAPSLSRLGNSDTIPHRLKACESFNIAWPGGFGGDESPRGLKPALQGNCGTTGNAELFNFGEEVGDDVFGVGGVEEAGGGEVGCHEVKQRPKIPRVGVDGGELH
jgi:hypothetical protein